MTDRNYDLSERLLNFGVEAIKMTASLSKTYAERHVGQQLLRSATSAGANYEETCGAESRSDFVHKLQIVHKELKESKYWLKLLYETNLGHSNQVSVLLKKADELSRIIGKSVSTTKLNWKP